MSAVRARLGGLARDALRVLWRQQTVTSDGLWRHLRRSSWDNNLAVAMNRLRASGLVHGEVVKGDQGRLVTQWSIADFEGVQDMLTKPARQADSNSLAYIEQFANPDFGLSERVRELNERCKAWEGPVAGPRLVREDYSGRLDAPRPVVRSGSLDALRLRSVRWDHRHDVDPTDRLAVVEARA